MSGGSGTNETDIVKAPSGFLLGLVIGLCLGVAVGAGGMVLFHRTQPASILIRPPEPTPLPAATDTPGPIHVFVNGAVVASAVYELPPDSLVEQAIAAAGGFTADANKAVVNLAQPLSNGAQVYVPAKDEVLSGPGQVVSQPLMPVTSGQIAGDGGRVNINIATRAELETLPGIGPSIAQNILDYRDAHGPFASVEAIMDVSGIGEAKFGQLKELIIVQGE